MISIDGVGSCTFYFGTDDQVLNSTIGELLENEDYNTPYRNFCYAVMNDCYIGDYPRTPTFHFVVSKLPEFDFSDYNIIQDYDINPAHAIWYILTELGGLSESWLAVEDFESLASTCALESRGISLLLVNQQNAIEYIQTINNHIDNVLLYGVDEKFHSKLIRNDYDIENVPSISTDILQDDPTFQRVNWNDTINEIKTQYTKLEISRITGHALYSTGFGGDGALGLGDALNRSVFTLVPNHIFTHVKAGSGYVLGVKSNGTLWGTGKNTEGTLGLPGTQVINEYMQLGTDVDWLAPAPSGFASFIVKTDGSLWAAGRNSFGNLGVGDKVTRYDFTKVGSAAWLPQTAGYDYITVALREDGTLWASGNNAYYSGGWGVNGEHLVFTQEAEEFSNFIQVSGRSNGTLAIKSDGTMWAAGRTDYGQLGIGVANSDPVPLFIQVGTDSDWASVSLAEVHAMAIKTDGTLWGTGRGLNGQLGIPWTGDITSFTQIGTDTWEKIETHRYSSIGIKTDGTLWGTGSNSLHELGIEGITDTFEFLQTGNLESNWIDITMMYGSSFAMRAVT